MRRRFASPLLLGVWSESLEAWLSWRHPTRASNTPYHRGNPLAGRANSFTMSRKPPPRGYGDAARWLLRLTKALGGSGCSQRDAVAYAERRRLGRRANERRFVGSLVELVAGY